MYYLFKTTQKGFTLVELLVVIAIIGILVTIVVIAVDPGRLIQDSNDTKARSELNQVKTSLQLYFNENDVYPSDLTASATPVPFDVTYIRQVPTGITYGTNGSNYDAWITVNNSGSDETESHTKCTSDNDLAGGGGDADDYWICPD